MFHVSIVGKEFQGRRLKVSMARRKPMMGGMRGGMPMRDGMMGRGGKCPQKQINSALATIDSVLSAVVSSLNKTCPGYSWGGSVFIRLV